MKLIIFDLGNTLVKYKGISLNWSSHYSHALEEALDKQKISYTKADLDLAISILSFYNTRINFRTFETQESEVLSKVSKVFAADNIQFERGFFKYFQRETMIENDTMETLTQLRLSNHNIAVLTDVPYGMPKEFVFEDLKNLSTKIDLVLTSCEVGFRKPEIRGIKEIQSIFKTDDTSTFYIGDEQKDIECAQKAGIQSVLLNEENKNWGQSFTIKNLKEILKIVN